MDMYSVVKENPILAILRNIPLEYTERQYGTNCMQVIKKSVIFICIIVFPKKAQNG